MLDTLTLSLLKHESCFPAGFCEEDALFNGATYA